MQTFSESKYILNRNELTNLNKITQFDVRFTLTRRLKKKKRETTGKIKILKQKY